ncbi:galactokinase [Mariniflexile ostreae]|uniref:Galactokinase n=1 Tax=Mariniflexile ostreae TaxID=1520892 RepID=A0ABV5FDD2_9FLAO
MDNTMVARIKAKFKSKFQTEPLLVFSPGRINIIGEHTDYNEGFVFPAAIDRGIVAAIQKSDAAVSTAFAADKDSGIEFSLDNVKPLASGHWGNYILGVVSEIQKKGIEIGNFDIVFGGDIPGGAGLSSSAALENSVAVGLNETFGLKLSKKDMIYISQKAEHNFAGVHCGIMDQYASMFGVKDHALLLDCRTIQATPFKIDFKDHELVLVNTNVKHSLSDSAYNNRRSVCESVSKMLHIPALRDASEKDLLSIKDKISEEDYQKVLYVVQENQRTIDAGNAMKTDNMEALGKLLYASHYGLSNQYKVSCDELDFLVEEAKASGQVIGARMMGGGFGGCTINLVLKSGSKQFQESVAKAYQNKFNKACSIYAVSLSNGAGLV